MSNSPQTLPAEPKTVDRTLSTLAVNLIGVVLGTAIFVIVVGAYVFVWDEFSVGIAPIPFLAFVAIVFLSIVVHELLHGLGYLVGGAPRESVKIGVQWKILTPYAHCAVPLPASRYRVAVALPGLLLGLIPTVAGIALQSEELTLYGAIMLVGAVGDMLILWLLRSVRGDTLVLDHPTRAGFQIVLDS